MSVKLLLENRIARARKGIPTSGALPFGRSFNRETNQWSLDEEKARLMRWAADEYLKGKSLRDLSEILKTRYKLPLGYVSLISILSKKSGDTWTVNFKSQEPITYKIPRILDDATIEKVKERLAYNRIDNRTDARKYILSSFIRCEECGKNLTGQSWTNKSGLVSYYRHRVNRREPEPCLALSGIPAKQIKNAVFKTIFENIVDVPAFEMAIQDSLPDKNLIKSLEEQIKAGERELKRIRRKLDKLVDAVLSGTLEKATIKNKEKSLYEAKAKVTEELEKNQERLRSMPDLAQVKQEAETIRRQLLEDYSSEEHLQEMSFDEKKQLLHWLFDGKDRAGKPYGIYISKRGNKKFDYFLYGKITGLRTMKGDDIDYQAWDEDDEIFKTNKDAFK